MATAVPSSVSPSPSNVTFGNLKAEVAAVVRSPDDPEALTIAGYGINDGVRQLNMETWWWTLTHVDLTLVASTADYTIPSNYKASFLLQMLDSSDDPQFILPYHEPNEFNHLYPQVSDGDPSGFTVYDHIDTATLSFNTKVPTGFISSYPTARLRYFRTLNTMSGGSDALIAPSHAELYIKAHGEWYVTRRFGSFRQTRDALFEKQRVWNELRAENSQHHFTSWNGYL